MSNIFLKKNKYILIISLFILVLYGLAFPCLFADDNINTSNENEVNYVSEYKEIIDKYLEQINTRIKDIDDLILYMKSQKEYTKYPAVRLNMQTPFLGISAIVENKLQVSENVSIFDRTSSYSIRDIVKKKIVKVPSFSIASIVLLTKDLNIYDSSITREELNNVLTLLQKYKIQVEDVYLFVKEQRNNIFSDYVSKDIKSKIEEYKNEIIKIQNQTLENDYKLLLLKESSLSLEDEELNLIEEKYLNIYAESKNIFNELENILISQEELDNVNKKIEKLKENINKISDEINLKYDVEVLNLNVDNILKNIQIDIKNNISKLNEYITSSEITEKVGDTDTDKVITKYEIKEANLIDELKEFDIEIETEIIKRINANLNEEYLKKVYTNDQEIEYINNLNKKYISLINKIKEFYRINSDNLLKINVSRLESLIKYTNVSVYKYLNDIYFDIPNNIKELNKKNFNSTINDFYLIKEYSEKIEKILNYSEEIYAIYNEKLKSGEIKS